MRSAGHRACGHWITTSGPPDIGAGFSPHPATGQDPRVQAQARHGHCWRPDNEPRGGGHWVINPYFHAADLAEDDGSGRIRRGVASSLALPRLPVGFGGRVSRRTRGGGPVEFGDVSMSRRSWGLINGLGYEQGYLRAGDAAVGYSALPTLLEKLEDRRTMVESIPGRALHSLRTYESTGTGVQATAG